jgi:hypothetical protein
MGNQVLSILPPPWFLLFSFFLKRMHNPEYGNYSSLSQWGYGPILHKLKGTVRYGTPVLYFAIYDGYLFGGYEDSLLRMIEFNFYQVYTSCMNFMCSQLRL